MDCGNESCFYLQRFLLDVDELMEAQPRTAALQLRKALVLVESERYLCNSESLQVLETELLGTHANIMRNQRKRGRKTDSVANSIATNLEKLEKKQCSKLNADLVPPPSRNEFLSLLSAEDKTQLVQNPTQSSTTVQPLFVPFTSFVNQSKNESPPMTSRPLWKENNDVVEFNNNNKPRLSGAGWTPAGFARGSGSRHALSSEGDEEDNFEQSHKGPQSFGFVSAREQLTIENNKQQQSANHRSRQFSTNNLSTTTTTTAMYSNNNNNNYNNNNRGRSLGSRGGRAKFNSPVNRGVSEEESFSYYNLSAPGRNNNGGSSSRSNNTEPTDERLKNIEPKMIELISNEMLDRSPQVDWEDIAGLDHAKKSIKEIVVWPMLRPDIFTGLRGPPKGLLLFGPPGTGKTLIGKCIASQAGATFFSISASSLTSKWVGEGEKMVRALFAVARCHQPAVVFIDEIDSLLSQRTDGEMEANRRLKTEFLVQLDGATTSSEDRLLIVGATNRPHEIDEAARRRLVKRLYIPLPEDGARRSIIANLLRNQKHDLSEQDLDHVVGATAGYSGSDMANLCKEAAMGPIRTIQDISRISADEVRPIQLVDFQYALTQVRASVGSKDLLLYEDWNKSYGSLG